MAGKKGKRDNNDYRPRKKDANLSEEEDDDFVDDIDSRPSTGVVWEVTCELLGVDVSGRQVQYSVFLFEMMLLCCTEEFDRRQVQADDTEPPLYLVRVWELGPALQRTTPLNLVHAIPTTRLRVLRLTDSDTFELEWFDETNSPRIFEFYTLSSSFLFDEEEAGTSRLIPLG
ncbi:hypothetical protein B0H14DRAFT_3486956 [Mycena olivaceomarginata]|nr:hypothetical protein B0H14DRAFT_3486956 [Mycena olivaceomarginata]